MKPSTESDQGHELLCAAKRVARRAQRLFSRPSLGPRSSAVTNADRQENHAFDCVLKVFSRHTHARPANEKGLIRPADDAAT